MMGRVTRDITEFIFGFVLSCLLNPLVWCGFWGLVRLCNQGFGSAGNAEASTAQRGELIEEEKNDVVGPIIAISILIVLLFYILF
jgi:hypothetical protein